MNPAARYAFGSSPSLIRLITALPNPTLLIRPNHETRERVKTKWPYISSPKFLVKYIVATKPMIDAKIWEMKYIADV